MEEEGIHLIVDEKEREGDLEREKPMGSCQAHPLVTYFL